MPGTQYKFFNRDLSWLSFNYRVLMEAMDDSLPLYERIKFLAIYSNNLEEFYKVRVSYYRELHRRRKDFPEKNAATNPLKIIRDINNIVGKHQNEFSNLFHKKIIPELEKNKIFLSNANSKLSEKQEVFLKQFYNTEILTTIMPVILIKNKIKPFLRTGHVYLVIKMFSKSSITAKYRRKQSKYGLIKLPTDHGLQRFVELPKKGDSNYIIFLEDVIMKYINLIFPGYKIADWFSIKLTRDADMEVDEYEGEDLLEVIEKIETSRALGKPNRFQYDERMPKAILDYLAECFEIPSGVLVKGRNIPKFNDFFSLPNPLSPDLECEKLIPLKHPAFEKGKAVMEVISEKDYLLNFPYQRYDYFIQLLEEAARDETVEEIKATQYRVASNSAVVSALIKAAERGKKVTVFVELKARFDEEANLHYAEEMQKAGINIIYSMAGLKVHAKVCMILKTTGKSIAFMGTGNFNEKTARLYGDHGFFTSNSEIINDLKQLFEYLENRNKTCKFSHILVPRFNMVETYKTLIEREIENVKNGKKGYILLKMNGLQDPIMVEKLYRASEAGVKIDIIVRGICILIPGQPYSKNINLIRIVDRFLEHARVFVFYNNGKNNIYMGSADWMKRNLYRRIECVFPIYNEEIKQEVIDILNIQLNDNVKACRIGTEMENIPAGKNGKKIKSQIETYKYLVDKYLNEYEN